jgi:hypothetical protein
MYEQGIVLHFNFSKKYIKIFFFKKRKAVCLGWASNNIGVAV